MEDLFRQRDELREKILALAQAYDSPDNATNANQIVELHAAQAALLVQRDALTDKIATLDAEYRAADKIIAEKFSADVQKILAAIKSQRWFFFANNDKILFDKTTALLWANLDKFPYLKSDGYYQFSNSYAEVRTLLAEKNSERWGNIGDWKIPTAYELWQMIEDKTFPFYTGSNWRIKNCNPCCVDYNGGLAGKDLDDSGATTDISSSYIVYVLPCSHALVPQNFSATPQEILDIFTRNNLVPKFNDASANELYSKIFGDKFALIEVERQISALQATPIELTANFNYRQVLAKFDTVAVAKSPIKYFDAVLCLTDELLDALNRYESTQAGTIGQFLKLAQNLNAKHIDNPNLTPEENSLLADCQNFLARRLELRTDEPRKKILSVKAQAENFFKMLDAINADENSLRYLAALNAEPRVDFELLVENLSRIILDIQRRVDFFAAHRDAVSIIMEAHAKWSNDYNNFKTKMHGNFRNNCRNINRTIRLTWYEDWRGIRFAIAQRFLPLVEFVLKGNLSNAFKNTLEILRHYQESVDKFYLERRRAIYIKVANGHGSDLQDRFETENEFYTLTVKFQEDLFKIIFACDKIEERIFLLEWAKPLLDPQLDELSKFISDSEFDTISQEILKYSTKMKRQNFTKFLTDEKAFKDAFNKRQEEYNALLYNMRRALNKHN